jgi:staphylococcal nuclease domain-containing protein 1
LILQDEWKTDAVYAIENELLDKQFLVNVEYKNSGVEYVTLSHDKDTKDDVAEKLIGEGLVLVENRREKRLQNVVSDYVAAQDKAKSQRVSSLML